MPLAKGKSIGSFKDLEYLLDQLERGPDDAQAGEPGLGAIAKLR